LILKNPFHTDKVTNNGFGDFEWKSPFDTCPAFSAPLSLINLQVAVGGQNVLQSTLHMKCEHFLQQRRGVAEGSWCTFK
jgi:hypothetical protein